MTLRTVLRRVIRAQVRIYGFGTPREVTGVGRDHGLDLTRGRGGDLGVIDTVGRIRDILGDGETRSRTCVDGQIDALLLGQIRVRVVRRQGCGHRGLLWNVRRWNRRDIVRVQVDVRRRLLLLLRLILAWLLECRSKTGKNGLSVSLERLS